MILSETKAKGMTISFLKRVENDLSMLSCHLHGHLTPFHSLFIANQNLSYSSPNLLSFIHFLFCLLDIIISFILSVFIIIPFSRALGATAPTRKASLPCLSNDRW